MLAERAGLRIHEVPVDWTDAADSRVNIIGDRARRPARHLAAPLRPRPGTIKVPRLRPRTSGHGARLLAGERRPMSATTVTAPGSRTGAAGRGTAAPPGGAARPADPRWARPALLGLLAVTALLYLLDLSRNGYANDFYAAAVQAGTRSWKAFFFGSFDSSNFITVDKTPASLWVDELSARIFGFSSWTLLAPQAIEGVLSVLMLYLAVRRWFGPGAGLVAGAVLALTPAAALIFRFNNPDALLMLLMTAAGYARAARDRARTGCAGWCSPGCCSASRSSPRCSRPSSCCPGSGSPTWGRGRRGCRAGSGMSSRPARA